MTGGRAVLRALWTYVGDVMGDNDYQRYLRHHRARHTGAPMSEGQYWRERHAAAEADPRSRCC